MSSTCKHMGIGTIYSIISCSPVMRSTQQKVCPMDRNNSDLDIADVLHSALKLEALAWQFMDDPIDVQNTFDPIYVLYKFHGCASGTSYYQILLIEADMVSSNQTLSLLMNILLDLTLHREPNFVLLCKWNCRWFLIN